MPEPLRITEPITTDNSLKRDIIKYLYKNNQCGYLKSAISDEGELEKLSDDILYKKFRIGLVIDSVLGRTSSDKNLASYVFTFFETLLEEVQKLSSPEYKKYFEVFSLSLKKDKVLLLSDSNSSTIALQQTILIHFYKNMYHLIYPLYEPLNVAFKIFLF